ncbi:MAG TPA: hypothetical protein VK147_12270 [Candidatus Didemnitutus sp.]|nr:hypothetical protein [Candidatus Didemnitutus sp.]
MKHFMTVFVSVIALLVVTVENTLACPACKDSFTKAGANGSVGDAYSWSILFMLGVPLTIVTVATVVVARRLRQHPNGIV